MMHRTALRAVGFCLLAGAIVGRPGSAVAFADGEVLQPGVTAEFELAVGAMRRHAVTLEAGQLLHVEVREKGPRVLLALLDGNGSVLARRQALFFELTTLRLLAIAPASGTYSLEVRSSGEGRPGTYEIRMDEPRAETGHDRALVAADEALAEALRLSKGAVEQDKRAHAQLDTAESGPGPRRGASIQRPALPVKLAP